MGSSLSPVLEAYLAGQRQQESLLNSAQDIVQKRQAGQQRQQELNDIMKRFDISSKMESQRVANETERTRLEHEAHLQTARNMFREQLQQDPNSAPGTVQIPGFNLGGGVPGTSPLAIPGIQAAPAVGQQVTDPNTGVSIPMPTSAVNLAVQQQKALMPGIVETKRQEAEAEADAYVRKQAPKFQAQIDQLTSKLTDNDKNWEARLQTQRDVADIRANQAANTASLGIQRFMLEHGLSTDPEENRKTVVNAVNQAAVGNSPGNFHADLGPVLGASVQKVWDQLGYKKVKPTDRDEFMGLGNDTSQFLNTLSVGKSRLGQPNSLASRAADSIKSLIPGYVPNTYKSVYDVLALDQLPRLEKTLGMTPGALSKSPKLLDKIKVMVPLPGDSPSTVQLKESNGASLFLDAAARKIAGLPAQQRAKFWQDMANDRQDLIGRNPVIREKLFKAGNTGNWEAGSILKDLEAR